ncbi:hypothetical protein OSH08_17055 [Kaistia geumhonensis]|uniref:Potassium channel domain-containing protein n=1 Tax=Kaistia geumhonensis TaxID=410839 RepID=A0ABU0M9F2_9HYPH|nr:hypothetical protein [Kaistia geumhonensis]MCX5480712.1 hypothetical protein [Kaistia geumhonensis]MDQ0517584.1 hypothetical protein [Kaistia geumhonensis]
MIVLGILSVFAVLACHWLGIFLIRSLFNATLGSFPVRRVMGAEVSFGLAIFGLVLINFADVTVCALLVMAGSQVPGSVPMNFGDAFLYAISNFTTLGLAAPEGSRVPPIAGPLIAMSGIVSFGWSTSFLVACSHAAQKWRNASGAL